ncbi:pilus assembly PilX family protein [Thiolinea disciformis]|uniref:pilus assembly PilX family protein n=1 Tax=Thiolinea disciformis TaxID=125614 RepID=UPI000361BA20|nr:PilX N-terminal domain-containing pilus assembly protein [Thiolinea disciformis]
MNKKKQRGNVLIFALVLLLIMTLMSLTSVQGVNLQESMATNLQDREMAFQAAEAALRAAEKLLESTSSSNTMIDCTLMAVNLCPPVPANTFVADDTTGWVNVTDYPNKTMLGGNPQYYIQLLGIGTSLGATGQGNNLSNAQYGVNTGVQVQRFYRVTARSSVPSASSDRAIVVLQTTISRAI